MMKMIQSLIHYCHPLPGPRTGPGLHFAGWPEAILETGANGLPLGPAAHGPIANLPKSNLRYADCSFCLLHTTGVC